MVSRVLSNQIQDAIREIDVLVGAVLFDVQRCRSEPSLKLIEVDCASQQSGNLQTHFGDRPSHYHSSYLVLAKV